MASSPSIPDPNAASVAGALAQAGTFPFQQYIDYLAQTGGSANIGGTNYNFTGLGNAQQNAAVSQVMLPAELQIQQQYGPQYTALASQNLQQANPQAVAARQQEFQGIISNAQQTPNRPMAADLQNQILALTGQGSNLTTGPNSETEAVQQQARGQQVANGIYLGNAPASQEASAVVNAGDQLQQQRQQQALDFLQSGVSPEDVTYRRVQQSLSNLGNAINGQTPEAQFQSLSGAANGAAPFSPGNVQSPSMNTNSSLQGLQNAADIYSGNVNWAENQANPWTVGLSSLSGAASLLNNSGAFGSNGLFGSSGPIANTALANTPLAGNVPMGPAPSITADEQM
ncbi:MAG TPA: hypothetical protein VMF08_13590 [Candidatus Sulfotelmatobacter sp.]|nr:hypothetical protein [Candidatus Sulfotelmatobacter sp.]